MKKRNIVLIIVSVIVIIGALIILFFSKNSDIKDPIVKFSGFTSYESFFQNVQIYPDTYSVRLSDSFGLDDEKIEDISEHPENWLAYNVFFTVENSNDFEIVLDEINQSKQGKNGIYIQRYLTATQIVNNQGPATICVTALFNNGEISDEQAEELVKNISFKLTYHVLESNESETQKSYEVKVES